MMSFCAGRLRAAIIALVPYLVAVHFYVDWITGARLDVLASAAGAPMREAMLHLPAIYILTLWLGEAVITLGPVLPGFLAIYLVVRRAYPESNRQ